MEKQEILREAQKIAANYSFWMVSGNIAHLYGIVYETPEKKYELEIKFDDQFPNSPPNLLYHDEIKELLGDFHLEAISNWIPESAVVDLIHELSIKIQKALETLHQESKSKIDLLETEKYITPNLNAFPLDFEIDGFTLPTFSNDNQYEMNSSLNTNLNFNKNSKTESQPSYQEQFFEESESSSVDISTELGLIQQEYAYDQKGPKGGDINVYITITLAKTFIIAVDFTRYPEKPILSFPEEVINILGDLNKTLETLKKWSSKKPLHIIDILHELEIKLYLIKDIEVESKKISGEYQCEMFSESVTKLKVHLLTYGFKDYIMGIDLENYPKPPKISLTHELQQIINIPFTELKSYKSWREKESEPVEIIREISWLVDKNSRINFEIDLLKDHYKDIKYDQLTALINVDMKGKMKTQDITFEFQIGLPTEYPMKIPEIKVLNEFELEAHEKIKSVLHSSFNDFFKEWTPFSYLIDLFNLISKKIFEVSVVSCVICHKIECPSCTKKIAGDDDCHAECPHCNRAYHNHCWEQTIKSFGKCGFCLR